MRRPTLACFALVGLTGCPTADVVAPPPEAELYPLSDPAFGEYLDYLEVPGVLSEETSDGAVQWSIDVSLVDGVAELPISKTSATVKALAEAGVVTAEDKIVDLDGIQYFVNLESLRMTANDVEELDVTALPNLNRLEMNFNLVGDLDLTQNPLLDRFRYQGSSQAEDGQKLTAVDLSGNPVLRHLYLPNHELVTIDLSNNPLIDDVLDLSGNPGPDGDPETPDIVVPAAIYDQVPEEFRLGVISDADAELQVAIVASNASMFEPGGSITFSANLNLLADTDVVVELTLSGSATLGDDYTIETTELTIPAGELSAQTTMTSIDDDLEEGVETVRVTIASVTGAEPAKRDTVEVSIGDDDLPPVILLNEILYDPSNEPADKSGHLPGDANGDGIYVQDDDEFIELVNISGGTLDLSDWAVWDTEAWELVKPRHVFPKGTTLADGEALVLFGGGSPAGSFGGTQVFTATSGRMNLNNSGDILRVTDADAVIVLEFDIEPLSNNPNESYTRSPDLSGDFVQHSGVVPGTLFSPGTRADGKPL